MKTEMTSKERVLTALSHKNTDRIPMDIGSVNEPVKKNLKEYLKLQSINDVNAFLESYSDFRGANPEYIGPKDRCCTIEGGKSIDIWKVVREPVSYGEGCYDEICRYPLSGMNDAAELDQYEWPSAEWWDATHIKEYIKGINKTNEYAIVTANGNIFERSWYMRGFEQMLVDLIDNQELAWEIMKRVTDYFIGHLRNILEHANGLVDIVVTADDLGGQENLIMSLDLWEKMLKPHHVRLNKVLHEYGVKIMYHSCGAIMSIVPELIDMGIDILQPLQFDAKGMDSTRLKNEYGEKLCFYGGLSVQKTLPLGSVSDVRNEVLDHIRVLGKNGGYILAPSHAIQAGTPPENVIAFLDTGRNHKII
ncbi:MAG: uroporphyrinogen decarboxylase family protein [Clostridiales bacterium]|nr:uroporphyrinogen decarboxylase family protein [Clostridiales bacterium]